MVGREGKGGGQPSKTVYLEDNQYFDGAEQVFVRVNKLETYSARL